MIEPRPPNKLTPPNTTAATEFSSNAQRRQLTDQLDKAVRAARHGQTTKAIRELRELKDLVKRTRFLDPSLRSVLLRDADAMIDQLRNG
jgi:hypothetical protein